MLVLVWVVRRPGPIAVRKGRRTVRVRPPGEAGMGAVGLMQLADHRPSQRGAIVRLATPSRSWRGCAGAAHPHENAAGTRALAG
jgi:hypothetical protein